MLKLKYYLLVLLILILLGCEQIDNSQKSGEKIYDIARLVNGTIVYEKKTLNQISKEDLANGNFMYKGGGGGLIVTDIKSEEDKQLAEKYESDLFRKPEFIRKYDEYTKLEQSFIVFNKEMLSYHPELKSFGPEFFMNDYGLNSMCHGMLESYHRLQECDFSIQCEIEADFFFEKHCIRRLAELTEDESWCDKIRLNIDHDCYAIMAWQKKDAKLCWKIQGGDNPVMECFTNVAKWQKSPGICEEMKVWYEDRLKDKENSTYLSEKLSKDLIKQCKQDVNEFEIPFWYLSEDELNNITELIHCKLFRTRYDRKLCEDYIYNKRKIDKVNKCTSEFKFDYEIANCLASNFPINELEEVENTYQDQSCNFLDLKQNESIPIAGRVTSKGYTSYDKMYYIEIFNTHHPDVRSCSGVNCKSNYPIDNIEPGDGVYLIGDYIKWGCGGGTCSRCDIKEVKKVFKP